MSHSHAQGWKWFGWPVTWVIFLVGQMGIIHILNYLNVTHISHVSLENSASGKWVNLALGLMNALKYHQCDTSPRCLQACGILRFYLQVICTRDQFCILPRMKKSMALFHIKNFSCTFKRKLQHAGHKWVTCGSHPDCSIGQWVKWVNRTGVTHF